MISDAVTLQRPLEADFSPKCFFIAMKIIAAILLLSVCLESPAVAIDPTQPLLVTGGTQVEIKAALVKARKLKQAVSPKSPVGGWLWTQVQPSVVLRGRFRITEPIVLEWSDQILGDGALLDCRGMDDVNAFAIDATKGWRVGIRGRLAVLGAPNGIRIFTGDMIDNLAGGMTVIEGIEISNCAGVALWIEARSSTVEVSRCKFDKVGRVAVNRMCDNLLLRECWVYPSPPPHDDFAYIEHNYGKLRIEGGIWTPRHTDRAGISWVEMKNCPYTDEFMFMADKTRFGGEHRGYYVVRCSQAGRSPKKGVNTGAGVSIRLRDLNVYKYPSKGDNARGVTGGPMVLLDFLPNLIEISGCVGRVHGPLVQLAHNAPEDFSGDLTLGSARHPGRITIGPTNLVPNAGPGGNQSVEDRLLPWLTP